MPIPRPQSKFKTTLSRSLNSSDGVIYLTELPTETLGFLIIERGTSNEEIVKYASLGSGLVSGCTRGLSTIGASEAAGTGDAHSVGSSVEMTDVHYYMARIIDSFNGVSATSANTFTLGVGSASLSSQGNSFFRIQASAGNLFQIGLSTNGFAVWSDDMGVSYNRLSATGGAINSGTAWENAGGTGNVKVSALISATGGISSVSDRFVVNQAASFIWSGTNFDVSATNWKHKNTTISCLAEELNRIVAGVSAYSMVTPFNLSALTDGGEVPTTNAHYHFFVAGLSSRTAGSTGVQYIDFTPTFTPRLVELEFFSGIGASDVGHGSGYATSATAEGCTYFIEDAGLAKQDSSNIVQLQDSTQTAVCIANVSVMSAGIVQLNWSTNTSATADRYYTYKIYG